MLGLEATLNLILPALLPLVVPNEMKPSRLVAVQLQPPGADMLISPAPPFALKEELAGVMELIQDAPACTIVNTWPSTVIVPVRMAGPVFVSTE
jgi:hypothetical protein